VTSLCSKCGAVLSPGAQFCAGCGAPQAAAPMAVPSTVPPAAPPAGSGSSALKIVLIIVAVFVGLGVLGAGAFGFFVWRVAHSIHVSGSGNAASISTPLGSISANDAQTFTASDLGIDIYPGAQPGKGSMRMSMPNGSMVSAVYVTPDSKDQVLAFYKSKFPGNASTYDNEKSSVITYGKTQQESVVVTVTSNVSEYGGKTQIVIVHTTSAKSA